MLDQNEEEDIEIKDKKKLSTRFWKIIILSIIILVVTSIIITYVYLTTVDKLNWGSGDQQKEILKKNQTGETLPVATFPDNKEYTLVEIMKKGESEGLDFCNTLDKQDIKEICMESYLSNKAKKEQNASVCKESKDSEFIKRCQYVIVSIVAKKYCEESKAKNDTNITPTNIGLCEQIDNEQDKANCYNPKQVIEVSDVGGIYSNRKCEGYINLY